MREILIPFRAIRTYSYVATPTETPVGVVENSSFVVEFDGEEFIAFDHPDGPDLRGYFAIDAINQQTGECVILRLATEEAR
jgi:hypothetical protein